MLTAQLQGAQLGSITDDVLSIINRVQPYVDVIQKVLDDPALPQVVSRVRTIASFPSGPSTPPKPGQPKPPPEKGIGLKKAIAPLDAYIWAHQHRKTAIALGVLTFLTPIAAGVLLGRASKRCVRAGGKK